MEEEEEDVVMLSSLAAFLVLNNLIELHCVSWPLHIRNLVWL